MRHRFFGVALTLCLIVAQLGSAFAQTAQSCAVDNDTDLFNRLKGITEPAVTRVHASFDYADAVARAWTQTEMSQTIERLAQREGDRLCSEWGALWCYATGYGAYAERAANEISAAVFESDAFERGLTAVTEGALATLAERFGADRERLADPIQTCITEYLGANFAPIVQGAASQAISIDLTTPQNIDGVSALGEVNVGVVLAGIILIISRRIVRRIATRVAGAVARRFVGKLIVRAIPFVGWALLAYEAVFEREGAIPGIVQAMYEPQVVLNLQEEIAGEIRLAMADNLNEIANGIVVETTDRWRAFQRANALVLGLAEQNAAFNRYLNSFSSSDELIPISQAASEIIEIEGEATLTTLIERNRMQEYVEAPEGARQIARRTQSIEQGLDWARIAGGRLGDVLDAGLYRVRDPNDLTKPALNFVLDLEDFSAIRTVAAAAPELVENLIRFGTQNVSRAALAMNATQFESFVGAMVRIDDTQARNIIWGVLENGTLTTDSVLAKTLGIAASGNQREAARLIFGDFWSLLSPSSIMSAAAGVLDGSLSFALIRERYLPVFIGGLVVALLFLLWLRRLIFPPRPKVIIRQVSDDKR